MKVLQCLTCLRLVISDRCLIKILHEYYRNTILRNVQVNKETVLQFKTDCYMLYFCIIYKNNK